MANTANKSAEAAPREEEVNVSSSGTNNEHDTQKANRNEDSSDNTGHAGSSGGKGKKKGKSKKGDGNNDNAGFKGATSGLESCVFWLRWERTNAPSYTHNIEHLRLYIRRTYKNKKRPFDANFVCDESNEATGRTQDT